MHINFKIDKKIWNYQRHLTKRLGLTRLIRVHTFKLKPTDTAPVWVRDHYDKSSKTYACHKYDDSNHEKFLKGTRKIYIDFTF